MKSIDYNPGDALLWDWRLVHRITETHPGMDTREVIYTSFLPDISVNREYVKKQLESFKRGVTPPDFCREEKMKYQRVPGWNEEFFNQLTPIERKLIGEK